MTKGNSFLLISLAVIALSGATANRNAKATTRGPCRAPAPPGTIRVLTEMLNKSTPTALAYLEPLGLLGKGSSTVALSTNDSLCARGSQLVDSLLGTASTGNPIFLYLVGTSHRVVDTWRRNYGTMGPGFVFDSTWTYKGTIGLPGNTRLFADTTLYVDTTSSRKND